MRKHASKIGIGTAQWGMNYGVANKHGQTPQEEVRRILKFAQAAGIALLDTAPLYGNSELVLGQESLSSFRVVTKTPKLDTCPNMNEATDYLRRTLDSSLKNLQLDSIYGLLIHNADDILSPNGSRLVDSLQEYKSHGLISKIGISIYDSSQIRMALDLFRPDIVQVPLNVLDQRLIRDGSVARLSRLGIEVHTRSTFLQGLLLMSANKIPRYFKPWMPLLSGWHRFCDDHSTSPLHAALSFVCGLKEVSHTLVGVEDKKQLVEILGEPNAIENMDFDQFASDDPKILNPGLWKLA